MLFDIALCMILLAKFVFSSDKIEGNSYMNLDALTPIQL